MLGFVAGHAFVLSSLQDLLGGFLEPPGLYGADPACSKDVYFIHCLCTEQLCDLLKIYDSWWNTFQVKWSHI